MIVLTTIIHTSHSPASVYFVNTDYNIKMEEASEQDYEFSWFTQTLRMVVTLS